MKEFLALVLIAFFGLAIPFIVFMMYLRLSISFPKKEKGEEDET